MAVLSFVLVGITFFLSDFLRRYVQTGLSTSSNAKTYLVDFLLVLELCTGSFELGVIFEQYGIVAWSAGLYAVCVYQCIRWRGFGAPSPIKDAASLLDGSQSVSESLKRIGFLILSGLISYRYTHSVHLILIHSLFICDEYFLLPDGKARSEWEFTPSNFIFTGT